MAWPHGHLKKPAGRLWPQIHPIRCSLDFRSPVSSHEFHLPLAVFIFRPILEVREMVLSTNAGDDMLHGPRGAKSFWLLFHASDRVFSAPPSRTHFPRFLFLSQTGEGDSLPRPAEWIRLGSTLLPQRSPLSSDGHRDEATLTC